MLKKALLLLFLLLGLEAKEITFDFFKDKPRSNAKDFYIHEYLKKHKLSKSEAEYFLGAIKSMKISTLKKLSKYLDDEYLAKDLACYDYDTKTLLKKSDDCIAIGLSFRDIFALNNNEAKMLQKRLSKSYPKLATKIKIIKSKSPFWSLMKYPELFCNVFNNVGDKAREKYFNQEISKQNLAFISPKKCFNRSIKKIVLNDKLDKLKKSLLNVDVNNTLSGDSNIYLAINALENNNSSLAAKFIKTSYNNAYYQSKKDRALYWSYMVEDDKAALEKLSKSSDFNIFSLLAKEKLGVKIQGVVYDLNVSDKKSRYDIQNPFEWVRILDRIDKSKDLKTLANEFNSSDVVAVKAFILERANKYKKHYLITPYKEYLKDKDKERKALIYSIARQESRFIPGAVSRSFALGQMQFMPFLARAMAKQKKIKNFELSEMFKTKVAYDFADTHLDFLEKSLSHPLFIAYAYNGGIGFTRKLLRKHFKKGKYEPFMSLELVPYAETKEYGKKIVANYYGYLKHYNIDVNLSNLINATIKK